MDPSPTPKFDNPKMDNCPALQLFGAGREKRIYAIPPYTHGGVARFRGSSVHALPLRRALRAVRRRRFLSRRDRHRRPGRPDVRLFRHRLLRDAGRREGHHGSESAAPHKERGAWLEPQLMPRRTISRCWSPRASRKILRPAARPAATCPSRSIPARCWRSSANPAPASRRCCNCCRRSSRRAPAGCRTGCATACCAISPRSARPSGGFCFAPTGALCIRTPRWGCGWRCRPAPMSASG